MPNWIEGTMKLRGKREDIRLFGIESGMEFIEEVIVHHGHGSEKGKIVFDNCISYEDWDWECPFPRMGG